MASAFLGLRSDDNASQPRYHDGLEVMVWDRVCGDPTCRSLRNRIDE